jgi:hypothetical protein
MKARQGKIVSLVIIGLLTAAILLNVGVTLVKHRPLSNLTSMLPGLLLILMFVNFWGRYDKLEAEHGPDYQATPVARRGLIILLAFVVALFAALVTYLLVRKG